MEKRFKLVIIDNESSEKIKEIDTDCIIGGVAISETDFTGVSLGCCNTEILAKTIASATSAIKHTIKHNPAAGLLAQFIMQVDEEESGGDDDE